MRGLASCRAIFLLSFVFVVYFSSFIVKKGIMWLMSSIDTLPYIIYRLLIDQFFHITEGPFLQKILFSEEHRTNFDRGDLRLSFKLNNKIDCKSTQLTFKCCINAVS